MATVNLAAAPSGAAILPPAATDGRSPQASGFAAILASVQATAGESAPANGPAAADAGDDLAAATTPAGDGKADAQLAAWLTLTRLAQQLTGTAMLNPPAGEVKAPSRGAGPAAAPTDSAVETNAADPASSGALALLPAMVALISTPTVLPSDDTSAGETAVIETGDPRAGVDLQAVASAPTVDVEPAVPTALDDVADAGPQGQTKAEPTVKTPIDPQSIKALLAELKNTAAPGLVNGASENAAGSSSGAETPSALAAEVGQSMRGKPGQGERRGSGDTNREGAGVEPLLDGKSRTAAAGLARAIAARFQANEGDASINPSATAPTAATSGRVSESTEGARHTTPLKYESASAAAFLAMPTSMAGVATAGRTASVSMAAPASGISGDVATELHSQIIQGMRMQATASGGDAQIRLQPDYLGDLAISLKVENGAVTARLSASSADVRQWIEANEPLLRQSLAQQDLRLEKLVVAEDEPASSKHEQEPAHEQAGQQPRPRRRRPENEATFEVVV